MLTESDYAIWSEQQKDAAPSWDEFAAELRAAGKCLECYGDGFVMEGWEFDNPVTTTCPGCKGTGHAAPMVAPGTCPWCGGKAHARACSSVRALLIDDAIDVEALIDSRDAVLDRLVELEVVL